VRASQSHRARRPERVRVLQQQHDVYQLQLQCLAPSERVRVRLTLFGVRGTQLNGTAQAIGTRVTLHCFIPRRGVVGRARLPVHLRGDTRTAPDHRVSSFFLRRVPRRVGHPTVPGRPVYLQWSSLFASGPHEPHHARLG
jgi:hypothetical protein